MIGWVGLIQWNTLSRCSLCSSLTIKIMSNRDKIVVWKSIFFVLVQETNIKSLLKIYLARTASFIVTAEHRVCCSKDTCPRVEYRRDTSFSNRNSLLFHSFVNGHSIFIPHLVKLVNTYHTSISQHHCSAFEIKLPLSIKMRTYAMKSQIHPYRDCITLDWGRQTSSTGAFAWCIDCNGRDLYLILRTGTIRRHDSRPSLRIWEVEILRYQDHPAAEHWYLLGVSFHQAEPFSTHQIASKWWLFLCLGFIVRLEREIGYWQQT